MPKRLNKMVAKEATIKKAIEATTTQLHRASSKPNLFEGMTRTYTPKDDAGEIIPPEERRVQASVEDQLNQAQRAWAELFQVTFEKDSGNCDAKVAVEVDGEILIKSAPVTYLLFLEKRLQDIHTFIEALPILDLQHEWSYDSKLALWRSSPVTTTRTKKEARAIVLYDATDKHPAQTQLISEDQVVGSYEVTHFSGAMGHDRKRDMLKRVRKLIQAVKDAREEANMTTIDTDQKVDPLLDYVFGTGTEKASDS